MTIHKYTLKKPAHQYYSVMSTTIKRQSTKAYHHSTTGLKMLKNMFGQKNVQSKGCSERQIKKMMSNILLGFNFLFSQIKSDIPLNNTEMGKANKSVKMQTQILFKLSGSMFFKWKKMRKNHNVQHVK